MELNPEHPATKVAHDHWHKIAALLLIKRGGKTAEDTAKPGPGNAVLTHFHRDSIDLELMKVEDAILILQAEKRTRCDA